MSAPRIAIVTGSSQGIGLKTCRQLADRDLHVILTARTPKKDTPMKRDVPRHTETGNQT